MSDFWDGAKSVLSVVAPTLASMVGGPLAGSATTAIIGALGLAPDTPEPAVAAALAGATPEQLVALKKADLEFQAAMAKLANDDRVSARGREVNLHDNTPKILAFIITAGFLGLLSVAAVRGFPVGNADALNILLGALGAAFGAVVSYYFGASSPHTTSGGVVTNPRPVSR